MNSALSVEALAKRCKRQESGLRPKLPPEPRTLNPPLAQTGDFASAALEPLSHTAWFKDARIGAFMHFLPNDAGEIAMVNDFDVDALARQLEVMGATWGRRDTREPTARWREWFLSVVAQDGVVSLDMGPNMDPKVGPIGAIGKEQAEQFRAIAQ